MKEENNSNSQDEKLFEQVKKDFFDPIDQKEASLEKENKEELQSKELKEEKEKYLRLFADFENHRKRTQKEQVELIKNASKDLISKILPILDDFQRAIEQIEISTNYQEGDKAKEDAKNGKGIILIYEKLLNVLKKENLEEIDPKKGEDLNTDFHEALSQMPAPLPELKGKIVEICSKGYKIGNKVLQHAKVIIGS